MWSIHHRVREESGHLFVCEVSSAEELARAAQQVNPTYSHLLAHGTPLPSGPLLFEAGHGQLA